MKYCKLGDHNLDESAFGKHKGRKDGFQDHCKICRQANRTDKPRPGYMQEYYLKNKEKLDADNRRRYEKSDKHQIYLDNKERVCEWDRKNRDKRAGYWQNHYKENKDQLILQNRENCKQRMKSDPGFRALNSIRKRLRRALKGERKMYSFMDSVGCSVNELKEYLESKFIPGMTWENYGYRGWHIDHIHPLSKFDLTRQDQFIKAVHYTNLQPLWWKENLEKSNRVISGTKE